MMLRVVLAAVLVRVDVVFFLRLFAAFHMQD